MRFRHALAGSLLVGPSACSAPALGPGQIGDAQEAELCVGLVDVPDPALREILLDVVEQPPPPEDMMEGDPPPEPVILAENLRKLRGLSAHEMGIVDLRGLECAQGLISLGLSDNDIADVAPLQNLTGLEQLELSNNAVSDLRDIGKLFRLRRLALDGNMISDVGPLQALANLESLDLGDNAITDISALAGLVRLGVLSLANNQLESAAPLEGLTQMFGLELQGNLLRSIEPLRTMTGLAFLQLSENEIESLEPLKGAVGMRELVANENALTSLEGIEAMTQLTRLEATDNAIGSTQGVAALGVLSTLDLENNAIVDLAGVGQLAALRRLVLAGNDVADIAAVTGLAELRDLDVRDNPRLSDLSPLATVPLLGTLRAGGMGVQQNLAPLAGREVLRAITYADAVAGDLAVFADLPGLESVNFSRTPLTAAQLGQIAQAGTLQSLSLQGCALDTIEPLDALPLVQTLDVRDNAITRVDAAAAWIDLRTIRLERNPLQSLAGLELQERLGEVNVSETPLDDLGPLVANETFRTGDQLTAEQTGLAADDCAAIAAIEARMGIVVTDLDCG
jgi:internalin A